MLFWFAVIVGIITAFIAVKKGFYPAWAVLFNILISIHVSILLTPSLVGWISDITESGYHQASCVAGVAIVVFVILQTIASLYVIKKGDYTVTLPHIFEKIGTPLIGFLSGYLVSSFLIFVICIMPFSKHPAAQTIFGKDKPAPTAVASITKACDFISVVSLHYKQDIVPKVVDWLIKPADEDTMPNRSNESTTEEI